MRAALVLALAIALPALATVLPPAVPRVLEGYALAPLAAVAAPTALAFGPGDADGADLYATTVAGDVVRVHLTWTAAGPVAASLSTHASGFGLPLGLAFDGDVLYVADSHAGEESGRVDGRVTRVAADGARTVLLDGLPNGRHNTNHLRFGPGGLLYVTNGNPNDNGRDGGDPDVLPLSGAILAIDAAATTQPQVLRWVDELGLPIPPGEIAAHPVNAGFAANVSVYATGLRNIFGVAFSPAGLGYTAMNGADDPSSQDALFKIATPGTDFGYPFCYNEGESGAVDGISVVPNPVFPTSSCAAYPAATALLGWHVCATGLDFGSADFLGALYIGECGPFFPEPQNRGLSTHDAGHKVVRVTLDEAGEAVSLVDFVTGLALPTDVLFGPDGALYVADAGGIVRVARVA